MMAETILTRNFARPDSHTLGVYRETGGYAAWAKAQAMEPAAITGGGQELEPPRARRRRVSDGHEVVVHPRRTTRARSTS